MKVARTVAELKKDLRSIPSSERPLGFVPTMGALHTGHLSLVHVAQRRCPIVAVSIFVNPLQFGPHEDLMSYPRAEEKDLEVLEEAGVDHVFLPSVDEMYPFGRSTTISIGDLATRVEGEVRPGHFDGVTTVVAKLFNLVGPDLAFFGQKDAQQVAVIKKMVADLSIPIDIVACPTVRATDGLALSSRNAHLNEEQRQKAIALWKALGEGRAAFSSDSDWDTIEKVMWETLVNGGVQPDYAKVVDPDTFQRPTSRTHALLVVAARVGDIRLIDNLLVTPEE